VGRLCQLQPAIIAKAELVKSQPALERWFMGQVDIQSGNLLRHPSGTAPLPTTGILVMRTKPQRSASVDAIQAQQYAFPYHFIPNPSGHPRFSKIWRFSASYIAALNISRTWLGGCSDLSSDWNHIDIGCGDGAYIYHLSHYPDFSDLSFTGVDFDERAISWARIFNGDRAQFESVDLAEITKESFQSATLIEVIEHIPPHELPKFVESCARVLGSGCIDLRRAA
jgi:SAM-dependent methyltransferase